MSAFWLNSTMAAPVVDDPRQPFSPVTYLLLTPLALACLVALNLNTLARFSAFVAVVAWTLAGTRTTAGTPMENYFVGLQLGFGCFLALLGLVLANPVQKWQHEAEPGPLMEKPFWKRVWYLSSLTYAVRCMGWTSQVPFLPPVEPNRGKYLLRKVRQLLISFIILDLIHVHKAMDPWFNIDAGQVTPPLSSQPYIRRVLASLMSGAMVCHLLNLQYNLLALVLVGLGIYEPKSWPDFFGDWSDSYTIRRFWARVWHQQVRRFTAPCGKAAASILGVKPGSWLSARVQLLVGFAASGLSHVPADYMSGPQWTGLSLPFFLWQAVGITIEDYVIKVASARGIKQSWWTRALGYLWVWPLWFTLTVPIFTEWMVPAGVAKGTMFTFSVVTPAVQFVQSTYGVNVMEYVTPELRYTQ